MSELDDDINRIAKRRDVDPEQYRAPTLESRDPDSLFKFLGPQRVHALFVPLYTDQNGAAVDQEVCDRLPPASRAFIRDCPVVCVAERWAEILEDIGGDEAALLALMRVYLPLKLKAGAAYRYGPQHPQAGGVKL